MLPPCVCDILSVTPPSVARPPTPRSPEKLPVEVALDRLNPLLPSMFPLTTKSPPKTDFDVPPTDPLTNSTASDVITGNDDAVFAITSVPVTAVLEVPLLPEIVPTRAIFTLSGNKYHSHREDESDIRFVLNLRLGFI